jgi:hypothetical protein
MVFGQFPLLTVHSLLLNEMAELLPLQKKYMFQAVLELRIGTRYFSVNRGDV